jgi:hypothetical protein
MQAASPGVGPNAFARIAGAAYVLVIVLGIASMSFVDRHFAAGDSQGTLGRVRADEGALRVAFLGEIVMYALVVVLALSLRALLKHIDDDVALLAALFRCGEAFIGSAFAVLTTAVPLWLVRHGGQDPNLHQSIHALLGMRGVALDVVLLFMGVGGILYFALLWRSRFVPRALAAWGLVTYATMIGVPIASVLTSGLSEGVKMMFFAPGGVFELLFGLWLVVRGVEQTSPLTSA